MVGKDFSKMPMSYSSLLFRHIDRCSASLSRGMEMMGNVHLLTSYYALVQHLEALLVPYHDQEYIRAVEEIENSFPGFDTTLHNLERNMRFLKACNRWLRLLIALAFKKDLLQVTSGVWADVEAEVTDSEVDNARDR